MSIQDNLERIQEHIAAACARRGRSPEEVTLVAVSKQQPPEAVLEAAGLGVQHFGENRVEEAQGKIPVVNQRAPQPLHWHMIGHLQSRKAKDAVPLFQMIHSVDRLKIARKLSDLAVMQQTRLPVLLEINISGEEAKYGFPLTNWQRDSSVREAFWQTMHTLRELPQLDIRGLMTMAPYYDEVERTRPIFASLAELRDALRGSFRLPLPELSMGMSNDYPVAVEEGATIVRIGRAVFGARH